MNDTRIERWALTQAELQNPAEGVWPYVSYWAGDMEGLMETTQEDDYLSVPNHGDGWHRVVACIELGLPTVDILFIEADE